MKNINLKQFYPVLVWSIYVVLAYVFFMYSTEILLVLRDLLDEDKEKQAVVLMFSEKLSDLSYLLLFGLIVGSLAGIKYAWDLSRMASSDPDLNRTLHIVRLMFGVVAGIIKFGIVYGFLYIFSVFLFIKDFGIVAGLVFAISMGSAICFSFHSNRFFHNSL